MTDNQTTLSEFGDDGGDVDVGDDPAPTPSENAADIERLVDLVGDLTDQVGTLAGELEQPDSAERIDTEPAHAERMFQ
jgi:hypothetical protein